MKNERLKQFAVAFFAVLSLVVSSFAAVCSCSSHDSPSHASSHCEREMAEHSARERSAQNSFVSLSENASCCCVEQSAPRVFAKTESVKIEKQTAQITSFAPIEFIVFAPRAFVKPIHFAAPFYLSDSFHNLAPGRAPPRL